MSHSTDEAILSVKQLSKVYGNRFTTKNIHALDKASLELKIGEICGLVGPNGAGKSTLIKLIMGIEPKTNGEVEIDDNGATTILGYVPERPTFFEDLTAYYNLYYIAKLNRLPDPDGISRKMLSDFGLEERRNDIVSTFSKGMKQRLAIARALVHSPKVLIMDEPFSGLDPTMVFELRGYLKKLKGTGLTVLISSHELNELDQVCESIIFIMSGHIVKKEDIQRGDGKVNMRLVILNPGDAISAALSGLKILSVSPDGGTILIETTKGDVPQILARVIGSGGQVLESAVIQRKAEDMYAEVFMKKGAQE